MVACVSPSIANCEQTLNTLRYADRVKERNPESGALSSSCQQPTKLTSRASSIVKAGQRLDLNLEQNRSEESENDENDQSQAGGIGRNTPSDVPVADSICSSPLSNSGTRKQPSTQKQKVAADLITEHRKVMSTWLGMVKNEMTLVNQVDADRDGLDDYLAELQNIQSTQLGLISKLRSSLQTYINHRAEEPNLSGAASDDESFEDLRD